jgi:Paf1 complex subunit CDC73 N-terminal
MDPLAILREYAMSKSLDQVAFDGDRVRFADKYSFQKAMPTAFRAKGGSGDHYSLEAVTLFIQSIVANSNMGAYVAKAVRSRVQQIELRDREV